MASASILPCNVDSALCARVTSFVIAVVFACSASFALASSASILPCNVASAAFALVASSLIVVDKLASAAFALVASLAIAVAFACSA